MLRYSHTATSAARGRTSILCDHHRYHSRLYSHLARFEPLESRQLLTATVIQVSTPADTVDPSDGLISLREAILEANASPDDNEIQLPAGTYTLTRQGANEDATLTGDLDILNNGSLKIVGAGSATTTIGASGLLDAGLGYGDRIFDIHSGAVVELASLKMSGGSTPPIGDFANRSGGAIRNSGGELGLIQSTISANKAASFGGGIYNGSGRLSIVDSTLDGNAASAGGGVDNRAAMEVTGSVFSNNTATNEAGGIYNRSFTDAVSISSSTLVGNTTRRGGGFYNLGIAKLTQSIVSGNTATEHGGIVNSNGKLLVIDCEISGNTAQGSAAISNLLFEVSPPRPFVGSGQLTIEGSTIASNVSTSRVQSTTGAMFNEGDLLISNSTVTGNSAQSPGGGICNTGTLTIQSSEISGNTSTREGGGIASFGSLTIANSIIRNNKALRGGGGIYTNSLNPHGAPELSVISTRISNNTATKGGGIDAQLTQVDVRDSAILDNSAETGGAIHFSGFSTPVADIPITELRIARSTLSGNVASIDGGGIYKFSAFLELSDSTLSGNSAYRDGGGVYVYSGAPTALRNTTITGNRANGDGDATGTGGGLYLFQGTNTSLANSLVAGNFGGIGPGATANDLASATGQIDSNSAYNLIGDPNTAGGLVHGVNGNIVGDGNGNPLDVSTVLDTTLADNGGPTLTHALVPGSPAFNAGDPLFDPNATNPPTPFDQRGIGFARVKLGRLDIGAFEGIPDPEPVAGLIVVGTFADVLDNEDGVWSLREAVIYANTHAEDNEIQLPAGTYTLTRQGANEDATLTGDLDILNNGSLKIVGAGSATTTIDASGLFDVGLGYGDRIFDVQAGVVLGIEGVTLTGGKLQEAVLDTDLGAAIRSLGGLLTIVSTTLSLNEGAAILAQDGQLDLVDSIVSGNSNGGVHGSGTATINITRCTFENNSTEGAGGAIVGGGEQQLSVVDSKFIGNSAGFWGGAIFTSSAQKPMTISGSSFTGNTAGQWGGAVATLYAYAAVTFNESSFLQNSAPVGGAVFQRTSYELTFLNCMLSNNISSAGSGGAIAIDLGYRTVVIENSTLTGNTASSSGGAISFRPRYDAPIEIRNSRLSNNSATGSGGGIDSDGLLRMTSTTVTGNHAGRSGGGVYGGVGSTIISSTIASNSAKEGGGVAGSGTIINSTVSGNSALNDGGGVTIGFQIRNSTITGNRADSDGDGIGKGGGVTHPQSLANTIVIGNVRGAAASSVASDIQFVTNTTLGASSVYNLIGDPASAGGLIHGVNGNIVGEGSGNPLDVSTVLDPTLADNGGPTLTHALVPGSPAFNAGDPSFDPNATNPPTPFDQRGAGYARVAGGRLDIGAVESDATFQVVVAGRHIFYDDSAFDNHSAGANATDLLAIAPDKQPLLPGGGLASSANVTSYAGGINGIMIDFAGTHPEITAADFIFRVGNSNSPETWGAAPAPSSVVVFAGQGTAGADRVVITWPSGAIVNTWLEVQVLATANSGLAAADVFYWGNKVGDTLAGTPGSTFDTSTVDAVQVFAGQGAFNPVTEARDFNRDGLVNTADAALVFANLGKIVRLSIPALAAPAAIVVSAVNDGSASQVATALANRSQQVPSAEAGLQSVAPVPQTPPVLRPREQFFAELSASEDDCELEDSRKEWVAGDEADQSADELALVLLGD